MNLREEIACLIQIDGIDKAELASMLTPVTETVYGDFALPCFKLSKVLRQSPVAIAESLAKSVTVGGIIRKAEPRNGYLNFFLDVPKFALELLPEVLTQDDGYGKANLGEGKTICIDYSSVNIAKPFHIGHLGTTAIGSSLYKIFKSLGYTVVGINHLGDWGTQFGKLITAFKLWSNRETIDKGGVRALQDIYVRFHREEEANPELTETARDWFKRVESGDPEAMELFDYFKRITLDEIGKVYDRLHVTFDSWHGESFFFDKVQPVLDDMRSKHLTEISDGAEIVDLSQFNMPPVILVKSNGGTLYITRDMATAHYRHDTYGFDKCLYVVAYQQNLYFRQLFKVLELEGCDWAKDLVHVAYGMVSLEEGSMSTRKGNVVWLEDVLNSAVDKAMSIIEQKSPDLEDKASVAEAVGSGAVIFSVLANNRIKDITFSLDRILSFEGETAPYMQYTHARACSLLTKTACDETVQPDYDSLDNDSAREILKLLNRYPSVVIDAADRYEPSVISNFLIDLAQSFNKFYFDYRISGEAESTKKARLMLVKATKNVLFNGLTLLGISPVEKM